MSAEVENLCGLKREDFQTTVMESRPTSSS